jgi:hypothetical protein
MRNAWLGVAVLACAGCNSADKLYPVSGKVTYRGGPAAGAAVFFCRRGADPFNEPTIMGVVRADGAFTLVCGARGDGAPAGEYDVLIEWKQNPPGGRGQMSQRPDRLKGRYADPKHPRFHAIVKAGANELPTFELTD